MASSPLLPTIRPSTRVLPDLFDFHAEHNPDLPWAMYAASENTVSSITYLELVKASHRAAYSLGLQELDSTAEREVVLMLIHCDTILYVTMILGIARAGMVVRQPFELPCGSQLDSYDLTAFPSLSSKLA